MIKAGESHADSKKGGGVFITSGAGTSAQERLLAASSS